MLGNWHRKSNNKNVIGDWEFTPKINAEVMAMTL